MKSWGAFALVMVALAGSIGAQTLDSSGNGLLSGQYNFRQVVYAFSNSGSRAIALYGSINFDGNGNYTLSGSTFDSNGPSSPQAFTKTSTYVISGSGLGYITSPCAVCGGDLIYGLVSNGIFVGTATENTSGYNDLFVAAQAASPAPTNSTFQGAYTLAYQNLTDARAPLDTLVTATADGQGGLGTVNLKGYTDTNPTAVTQTLAGVRYSFNNGIGSVVFGGGSNSLIRGTSTLNISPDGNFVFGGSPTDWDLFVGVRVPAGTPNFNGLYYEAGLDANADPSNGYFDTYFGSLSAYSGGTTLEHQRLAFSGSDPFDYSFQNKVQFNSDGSYDDTFLLAHYVFSQGAAIRIGLGVGPILGINVALHGPTLTGPGPYIFPTGVFNAGSFAPFTTGIARGEMLTIYGKGIAPSNAAAATVPLQTTLNGVQVLVNGRAAPIFSMISDPANGDQISILVPYFTEVAGTAGKRGVAQIQVINRNVSSNIVSALTNLTSPGLFTDQQNGLGYGRAQHTDFSLVTTSNPAKIGETISVYLTGLGDVNPAVSDGSPGSSNPPYNITTNTIVADFDGTPATIGFQGLAPQFAGLYQLNLQVPTGLTAGDHFLNVSGPDSYSSQALISVSTATAGVNATSIKQARPSIRTLRPKGSRPLTSLR